jgi:hypothetical protein
MAQGTVKDNVRDELEEAAWLRGVKDNVQDEWADSQERR